MTTFAVVVSTGPDAFGAYLVRALNQDHALAAVEKRAEPVAVGPVDEMEQRWDLTEEQPQ